MPGKLCHNTPTTCVKMFTYSKLKYCDLVKVPHKRCTVCK